MTDRRLISALVLLVLLLAACGPAATPTIAPTATQPPASTGPTATPAPGTVATATPRPVATATPATGVQPRQGGTLLVAKRGEPATWDPHGTPSGGRDTREIHNLVFGLLASPIPGEGNLCEIKVTPEVLESWRWVTDTTLELKVRQGIKFQNKPPVNGREVTADDVAFSIQRALKIPAFGGVDVLTPRVKEVKATDRYTVRVTTESFLMTFEDSVIASRYASTVLAPEAGGPEQSWEGPDHYIGSGPFALEKWQPGVKFVFTRHASYWKPGLPYVDRLEQVIMPDQSTRVSALRSGKLDTWFGVVPAVVIKEIESTAKQLQIQKCPADIGATHLWMRTDVPPLNDVRVRRAISMAIDRQAIKDTVLFGEAIVVVEHPKSTNPWHIGPEDLPPEIRGYQTYNPEAAKKLLAEAGYPNGLETVIAATRRYGTPYVEIAEALPSFLEKAGIRAKVNWVEYGRGSGTELRGNYDGILWTQWSHIHTISTLADLHSTSNFMRNRSHVKDPVLDKYIDQLMTSVDPLKQKEAAGLIQQRVAEQAYIIVTPVPYDYAVTAPWVQGFTWTGSYWFSGSYLEKVWIKR